MKWIVSPRFSNLDIILLGVGVGIFKDYGFFPLVLWCVVAGVAGAFACDKWSAKP